MNQHAPMPLPGQQPPVQDPHPLAPPPPVDDPGAPPLPPRDPGDPAPVHDPDPKPRTIGRPWHTRPACP